MTDDLTGAPLDGAQSVAVSPDGKDVYTAASLTDAVAVFRRDAMTGRLVFTEAQQDGIGGVDGLDGASGVTLSPDGAHVYATGSLGDTLAAFSRNAATGALTFVERKMDGLAGVEGLDGARAVTVSADGSHVYVASDDEDAVAVFSRNGVTGALTFVEVQRDGVGGVDGLDGASAIAVAPDGGHVYVAGSLDDAVAVFARNSTTGMLAFVELQRDGIGGVDGLDGATGVAVSPDGTSVYATGLSDDGLAVFQRNAITGSLTFVEVERHGVAGIDGLEGPRAVVVSAEGMSVYVASNALTLGDPGALAMFERDPMTGALGFLEAQHEFLRGVTGLFHVDSLATSPDGKHVYEAGDENVVVFQVVAVRCPAAPEAGCRTPTTSQKALLTLNTGGFQRRVVWKWRSGAGTALADFGDPATSTDYALCIYDASATPQPLVRAILPADNFCASDPCWKSVGTTAIKYRDREARPDGMVKATLKPGSAGEASVTVRGSGPNVDVPALPLTPPVTAQLISSTGECWAATYSTPTANTFPKFKAKGD